MIRHYATVCRESQLPVLLASMRRWCGDFRLHVLAWDYEPAPSYGRCVLVQTRGDFLADHPDLERLPGPPRSAVDMVATVRWRFFADVMRFIRQPLVTIDGDIWFWSSPEPMFDEIGAAHLAVTPHGIPSQRLGLLGVTLETHHVYGRYNAGFCYFAIPGPVMDLAAMNYQWSYTEVRQRDDGGYDFGDQGHLERVADDWRAHVIVHPGVNAAPWNIHLRGVRELGGSVYVGHRPLVAYHYSSYRHGEQIANDSYRITAYQRRLIYEPYIEEIERWTSKSASST